MASLWDVLPVVSTLDTLPAVRVSDVLPVPVDWLPLSVVAGIVCLWLLIGSRWDVLPVACGLVAVVSVGVGCAACAVVSTLDTLPAVRVWDGLPVSLWDVLPVVSTLDTLPACEGVGWSACACWLPVVSSLDTLPAVRVSDGEPVAAGICCLSVSL